MVVEAVGGILTNSLALLSDAGHMLSDAVSLLIALLAIHFGAKAPTRMKTFGYLRIEILAALLNGFTLIAIALYIFYEAINRFVSPPEVASIGMLVISVIGLIVNLVVATIMMRGSDTKENLNMRGAFLHVISDMLGSIGAIIAALCILFFDWGIADPIASVIVAVLVLRSGVQVMRSAVHVLMEGTPQSIDYETIRAVIQAHPAVHNVYNLHIWSITSGLHALTCRIVLSETLTISESVAVVKAIEHDLQHANIQHATIQVSLTDGELLCKLERKTDDTHHHH